MISKQRAKFVKSLKLKKYRKKATSFLVEGAKNIIELIHSDYDIEYLFVTEKFLNAYPNLNISGIDLTVCSEKELESFGTFQSNEYALAVARMKTKPLDISKEKLVLALDDLSDPGNLGTMLRIADWYGLRTVIASKNTADFYSPKVINATMGSFTRVHVHYVNLADFLSGNISHKVYGAVLNGENIHLVEFEFPAILLMGNESTGINTSLLSIVYKKITIPRIGGAESLNVAVSTAVICDNMLRD